MTDDAIDRLLEARGDELLGKEITSVRWKYPVEIILDDGTSIHFTDPYAAKILDHEGEEWSL